MPAVYYDLNVFHTVEMKNDLVTKYEKYFQYKAISGRKVFR